MSECIEDTTANLKGEVQFSFMSLSYKNVSFIAYFVLPNTDTRISHYITKTGDGNDVDHLVITQCSAEKPSVPGTHVEVTHHVTAEAPCHPGRTAQEGPREWEKELKMLTWPPKCPDLNSIEHQWDVPEQVWQMEAPPYTPQDTTRALCPQPDGSEPRLVQSCWMMFLVKPLFHAILDGIKVFFSE